MLVSNDFLKKINFLKNFKCCTCLIFHAEGKKSQNYWLKSEHNNFQSDVQWNVMEGDLENVFSASLVLDPPTVIFLGKSHKNVLDGAEFVAKRKGCLWRQRLELKTWPHNQKRKTQKYIENNDGPLDRATDICSVAEVKLVNLPLSLSNSLAVSA